MRRSIALLPVAALLALSAAAPVAAATPERTVVDFTTDAYVLAECDGYDVVEQDDVHLVIDSYFSKTGDWLREVFHSSASGTAWRSDTDALLATYSDAGGTFTSTVQNTFTWTGVHSAWTLTDGTTVRFVGRVVVQEVAPGEFERTFVAGTYGDLDPCAW